MAKPVVCLYYEFACALATMPAYKKKIRIVGIGVISKRDLARLACTLESYT